jgi:hypothetical protein
MVASLVVTTLTLQVHSAKCAKKSMLLMLKAKLLRQAGLNIIPLVRNFWLKSLSTWRGPQRMQREHERTITEIQEMFFDRIENERSISFLMTQ